MAKYHVVVDPMLPYPQIIHLQQKYSSLEYHPGVAWVLFKNGLKFGKTHPMWLIYMIIQIKCIICPDWCILLGGVW